MSKNIKQAVIKQISNENIAMRPKWIFILGSTISTIGLFLSGILTLLSIQLIKFRILHPGDGATRKIGFILNSLPWYLPVIAIASLAGGYLILKRYDFSYRKNIYFILGVIIAGLVFGSFLLHKLNIDQFMMRRGYFRQIYRGEQQVYPSAFPGKRMRWGR